MPMAEACTTRECINQGYPLGPFGAILPILLSSYNSYISVKLDI